MSIRSRFKETEALRSPRQKPKQRQNTETGIQKQNMTPSIRTQKRKETPGVETDCETGETVKRRKQETVREILARIEEKQMLRETEPTSVSAKNSIYCKITHTCSSKLGQVGQGEQEADEPGHLQGELVGLERGTEH